ncbi:AAA family ATPase [Niabella beijingensis]|uniref:AAA family ATPase n=1 Tax=Niabella beijingensis TaxID=2872700 RepID=UPI001CC0F1D5|nr:ATP-binding protein [Niabella beijingensis]MBZ4189279.1 AAA family ATPase [Niabella beijingensis]
MLIGRKKEQEQLKKICTSAQSEFIAVYGRRRVGKTFLIRETFANNFDFYITGMANVNTRQQLLNFHLALNKYDPAAKENIPPENWLMAFQRLITLLETKTSDQKIVFLDELPWLDTAQSGFMPALEHFWNSWASGRKDIVLVVCGSTASWMINKLIHNKGGLHNRVTRRIKLDPFTLAECEAFLKSRNAVFDRYQIIQLYMVMGGIPFYLNQVDPGRSAAQNIDRICFSESGLLVTEFDDLYRSLFNKAEKHIQIIEALSKKAKGLTRDAIITLTKLPNAGSTTRILKELEESGFIRKYNSFGKKERNSLYQLADFYSLFYLRFIVTRQDENNWINGLDDPKHRAWSGYAFEQVCLAHIKEIKQALGISGVQTSVSSWMGEGAQIDLVIDRKDQVINLCEMKFSLNDFTITKKYAGELRNKITAFREATGSRKALFLTLITTYGLTRNEYSGSLVQNDLNMELLFYVLADD